MFAPGTLDLYQAARVRVRENRTPAKINQRNIMGPFNESKGKLTAFAAQRWIQSKDTKDGPTNMLKFARQHEIHPSLLAKYFNLLQKGLPPPGNLSKTSIESSGENHAEEVTSSAVLETDREGTTARKRKA